jgi:hypothetical protein
LANEFRVTFLFIGFGLVDRRLPDGQRKQPKDDPDGDAGLCGKVMC